MSNYPEKLTDGYYYVRKTFEDKESQLARYRVLGNAKTKAEENPGYCVFAEDGTCVYAPAVDEAEAEQTETEQVEDAQIETLPSAKEEAAMQEAAEETMEGGNSTILGYGRPAYDAQTTTTAATQNAQTASGSFLVRVSISDLNIRTGPGTNFAKTGKFTGKGVFTIMEVKDGTGSANGWGRLKSGAGWISLDYAVRV